MSMAGECLFGRDGRAVGAVWFLGLFGIVRGKGDDGMPDSLQELFDNDREAAAFFATLPMFVQDQVRAMGTVVRTREELASLANNVARDGLKLSQYRTVFEDETDSEIDLQ